METVLGIGLGVCAEPAEKSVIEVKEGITITVDSIITLAAVISAVVAIFGIIFTIYKWYLKQNKQDVDIKQMKEENALIVFALSACLDGLQQLGANHTVPKAKDKLDKYINQQAHK